MIHELKKTKSVLDWRLSVRKLITEGRSSAWKTYPMYALRKFIEAVIKVKFDASTQGED